MALLAYPGDTAVAQVANPALQLRAPSLHGRHIERHALQLEVGLGCHASPGSAQLLVPAAAPYTPT